MCRNCNENHTLIIEGDSVTFELLCAALESNAAAAEEEQGGDGSDDTWHIQIRCVPVYDFSGGTGGASSFPSNSARVKVGARCVGAIKAMFPDDVAELERIYNASDERHDTALVQYINSVASKRDMSLDALLSCKWSEIMPKEADPVEMPLLKELMKSAGGADATSEVGHGASNVGLLSGTPPSCKCPAGHDLRPLGTSTDNGWACDGMRRDGGCARGCTGFRQSDGWGRFQCQACDYGKYHDPSM